MATYISELGFNDVKFAFAYVKENICFMLHQNYISIQAYKNSTEKYDNQNFYNKDNQIKSDNIIHENEGNNEYGIDFINCKNFNSKQ